MVLQNFKYIAEKFQNFRNIMLTKNLKNAIIKRVTVVKTKKGVANGYFQKIRNGT